MYSDIDSILFKNVILFIFGKDIKCTRLKKYVLATFNFYLHAD